MVPQADGSEQRLLASTEERKRVLPPSPSFTSAQISPIPFCSPHHTRNGVENRWRPLVSYLS